MSEKKVDKLDKEVEVIYEVSEYLSASEQNLLLFYWKDIRDTKEAKAFYKLSRAFLKVANKSKAKEVMRESLAILGVLELLIQLSGKYEKEFYEMYKGYKGKLLIDNENNY